MALPGQAQKITTMAKTGAKSLVHNTNGQGHQLENLHDQKRSGSILQRQRAGSDCRP